MIPTMKPTGDLPPMILFEDCKKGETSAKTGCTPASGEGGGEQSSPEAAEETVRKRKKDLWDQIDSKRTPQVKDLKRGEEVGIRTGSAGGGRDTLHKIISISRDGKTATVEQKKLTPEQKQQKKKNPKAYHKKVSTSDVVSKGSASRERLLDNASAAIGNDKFDLTQQILDGLG